MFVAQVTFSTKDFEVRSILDEKVSYAKECLVSLQGFKSAEVWKSEIKNQIRICYCFKN